MLSTIYAGLILPKNTNEGGGGVTPTPPSPPALLEVRTESGDVDVHTVTQIKVTDGKLTDNGGGSVSLDLSGGGGGGQSFPIYYGIADATLYPPEALAGLSPSLFAGFLSQLATETITAAPAPGAKFLLQKTATFTQGYFYFIIPDHFGAYNAVTGFRWGADDVPAPTESVKQFDLTNTTIFTGKKLVSANGLESISDIDDLIAARPATRMAPIRDEQGWAVVKFKIGNTLYRFHSFACWIVDTPAALTGVASIDTSRTDNLAAVGYDPAVSVYPWPYYSGWIQFSGLANSVYNVTQWAYDDTPGFDYRFYSAGADIPNVSDTGGTFPQSAPGLIITRMRGTGNTLSGNFPHNIDFVSDKVSLFVNIIPGSGYEWTTLSLETPDSNPSIGAVNTIVTQKGTLADAGGGVARLLLPAIGVETIAEAKALDTDLLKGFNGVFTAGYTSANDGGGADYYYDPDSTATVDNGSVHALDDGPGRLILNHKGLFNTKQFGCAADATYDWVLNLTAPLPTDDFVQLQAAFTFATMSGAKCIPSPGIYRSTGTLVISKGWGTNIEGPNMFPYPGTYADGNQKYTMIVLDKNSAGPLFMVRGALSYPGGGGTLPTDTDIGDYTSSAGYRNSGSVIKNLTFAAQRGSVSTVALVIMKRLARCFFQGITVFNSPYWGLEGYALDDSILDKCFFYVCGIIGKTYAVRLRGGTSITQPIPNQTEATYLATNTLSIRDCDYEGCWYGNAETCPVTPTPHTSTDGSGPTSITMINNIGKIVPVQENGHNCFNFRKCSVMHLVVTAAIGENSTTPAGTTATEIVKFDQCVGVTFDLRLGLGSPATALPTRPKLQLTRGITMVDCQSMQGRYVFQMPPDANIPSDEYMCNAAVGALGTQPNQIDVVGDMYFPFTALGKKACNVTGIPQNHDFQGLIGELVGADFNSTADQAMVMRAKRYKIRQIIADNASVPMSAAVGGINTLPALAGTAVVASTQVYSALTGGVFQIENVDLTLADNRTRVAAALYFKLGTAQFGAVSVSITSITRSGTTLTVTATAHGFSNGNVVVISGCDQPQYNITSAVTVTNANVFTVTLPAATNAATTATGTMSVKLAATADIRVYGNIFAS